MAASPEDIPEFLSSLPDYVATVPDEFTEYFMERSGIDISDPRLVRLLSLAAQRFIATALNDAMQIQAKRQKQPSAQLKDAGHDIKDKRPTLTIEDLAQALQEHGVDVKRPPYYADAPAQAQGKR
ncbi:g7495 [Coccomyxa viridis]|uniref:G7495 protein n=1 Tax=Coccomyxa viridis TaxID=1274662 RepID=A0ABP1G2W7_9CHLO